MVYGACRSTSISSVHAHRIAVPPRRRVLDQAHERGLAEERRLDPRHVELPQAVPHGIAGPEIGDGDRLPVGFRVLHSAAILPRSTCAPAEG
jgi:hypothetical protein